MRTRRGAVAILVVFHIIIGAECSTLAKTPERISEPAHIEWRTGRLAIGSKSSVQIHEAIAKMAARGAGRHLVVAFDAPLTRAEIAALEAAGLRVLSYLGSNAFFAALSPSTLDQAVLSTVASLTDVRAIERDWKLHPALLAEQPPPWSVLNDGKEGPIVAALVVFHGDVALEPTAYETAKRHGASIRSRLRSVNALVVELPLARIPSLASEDAVQWIEPPLPPFEGINDLTRQITEAEIAQAPPYSLDGFGVTVLVYDTGPGLDSHLDFGGRLHARDPGIASLHSTHVACTVGGDGTLSGGQYRGMAPAVAIESYAAGCCPSGFLYTDPLDIEQDYDEAINVYGADIATNSIGTNVCSNGLDCEWTGDYGVTAALIDSIVHGSLGEPFRIIWANGNERNCTRCREEGVHTPEGYHSTPPPSCAKNSITVGALGDDESVSAFTSWGPCDDGRLKPDLSAPGVSVRSCSNDGGYTGMSGTSMAAPAVAGVSALLLQDFRTHFPLADDPRNSTLKALLSHTAADLQNEGPDYQTGYGSVRIQQAIDFMRSNNGLNFLEAAVNQGEGLTLMVRVYADDAQLKVTVAWDDYPGTPNVDPALVNDLDLRVYDPNGIQHFPWTLDPDNPGAPAVRTQADRVNNIEQVVVDSPIEGLWLAEVFGYGVPNGPQPFSVCASPRLVHDCNDNGIPDDEDIQADPGLDCSGNGILDECEPDCDGDGVVDSCEIFVGSSTDCDRNGVPDDCEPFLDCNNNTTLDACDISEGTSLDCNGNWIPDECLDIELDCNANQISDECDVADGTSKDCNYNRIPDECEPSGDCNNNGVMDTCDIDNGTSADCNENNTPDECDPHGTIFVDDDAPNDPGPGDPTVSDPDEDGSAEHPYDSIQEAIDGVACGDPIIDIVELADGIYVGEGNRGVDYGGRTLTVRSANGPDNCIVDCEESGRGFHFHTGETPQARLEGITIRNGFATEGGAILCDQGSSPTIANCIITNNVADFRGGGIYCKAFSSPTISNCIFSENRGNGAGLASTASNPTVINSMFLGNSTPLSGTGGAIISFSGSPNIVNCRFTDNTASSAGAIFFVNAGSSPSITNCTFIGNSSAGIAGAVLSSLGASPTIVNSTFTNNTASRGGGALHLNGSTGSIQNTILWNNESPDGHEIGVEGADAVLAISYSNIEGGQAAIDVQDGATVVWGEGNFDADPLFAGAADYRVAAGSPCIDAGDNTAVPLTATTDLDGNPRFLDDAEAPDVGNGSPPIVDMGAFERNVDCDNNGINDAEEIASGTSPDCNNNGVLDICDLSDGVSEDCNVTLIPDECELVDNDCNANTLPDECELPGNDCDGNAVPDECDPDCNENGIPDSCDITVGTSQDCTGNWMPDECEPDCNLNSAADSCDIAWDASEDLNLDGIPDECAVTPKPALSPNDERKNRYISLNPANTMTSVALQIELASMRRCSGDLQATCVDDGDCASGTEPCVEHPHVGDVLGWAGEPDGNAVARVVHTPIFRVWPETLIHIGDCEVVPVATYEIRATLDGVVVSDPIEVGTIQNPGGWHYGDVVGLGTGDLPPLPGFTPPNRAVNVTDVQAYILTAQGPTSPSAHITWVDLHGLDPGTAPNYVLNVSDLQRIKFGFLGLPYTQTPDQLDPGDCP